MIRTVETEMKETAGIIVVDNIIDQKFIDTYQFFMQESSNFFKVNYTGTFSDDNNPQAVRMCRGNLYGNDNRTLQESFIEKFSSWIDPDIYSPGSILVLSQQGPRHMHIDSCHSDSSPTDGILSNCGKIVLVPLNINGITKIGKDENTVSQVKTIFMEQFYFSGGRHFINGSKDTSHTAVSTYNPEHFYDLKENVEFDKDFYEENFSHHKHEYLTGLSVHSVIEWKLGSCLISDRNRLHASNNYKKYGIKSKDFMLIIFPRKNK